MSKTFGISFAVGAALTAAFSNTLKTAKQKMQALEKEGQKLGVKAGIARDLNKYKTALVGVVQAQRNSGYTTQFYAGKLKTLKQQYREAAVQAKDYGVSVRDLMRQEKQYTAQSMLIARKRSRIERREQNKEVRSEMHPQFLGAVGLAATVGMPVAAAVEFESAMADVKKVVNFDSPAGLTQMRKDLLGLSTQIALTPTQFADIAAAAGQAGIAREEIVRFTTDAAKMGVAFDMSGKEAGSAMTGLRTLFKLDQAGVVSLGDAYNHLSNNMDATARDMLNVSNRAGSQAAVIGLTGQQVGALSATFLALKTPPDVAATGINALLSKLATADKGGKKFQDALHSIGLSGKGLKKAMEQDAQGAIINFLKAVKGSDDVIGTLTDLFDREYADDMAKLVNGLDTYEKALGLVADKAAYAGSMQKEFEERSKTTANSFQLAKNQAVRLAITIGSVLLPTINKGLKIFGGVVDKVTAFAEANPRLTESIVTLAAAVVTTKVALLGFRYASTLASDAWMMFGGAKDGKISLFARVKRYALRAGNALIAFAGAPIKSTIAGVRMLTAAVMANPIGLILGGVALLVYKFWPQISAFFKGFATGFSNAFDTVLNKVPALGSAIEAITGFFSALFSQSDATTAHFQYAGQQFGRFCAESIGAVASFVGAGIDLFTDFSGAIQWWGEVFSNLWTSIKSTASEGWQGVKSVLKSAIDWIRSIDLHALGVAWITSLIAGIKSKAGALMSTVKNTVSSALNKITFGVWSSSNTSSAKVAPYASGGLITRPHIGLVGEAGPEMIIPLTDRTRGRSLLSQAANILGVPQSGPPLFSMDTSSAPRSGAPNAAPITLHFAPVITINGAGDNGAAEVEQALDVALEQLKDQIAQLEHNRRRREFY